MKISWKKLILSLVIVYLVAFIGSIFTTKNVNTEWYESIRASITPPNWVFPIVWNILFFLIALSLYFVWINNQFTNIKTKIIIIYGVNFFLNIFWSFLFFYLKNPKFAFFEIFLLWISILYLIIFTFKINKKASYLLIPYLLWVSFAGVLNWLMIG